MAILNKEQSTIELVNGNNVSQDFTIKANAKSFKILSDNIYSNKILAVVRELSTNANDATIDAKKVSRFHRLLNKDLPYEDLYSKEFINNELSLLEKYPDYNLSDLQEQKYIVHIPNRNEPWFSIRDFGTGLSPEFIEKLYTQYFFSNKTTSNDYVGCMGLGSKSPFAYTDNFTVTSYWNGIKYVYAAYLDDGIPKINMVSKIDCDEQNGLLIKVNVGIDDINRFTNNIFDVYKYFKELPVFVGDSLLSRKIEEYRLSYKDCGDYYIDGKISGACALIGNIIYPIYSKHNKKLNNIIIKFDIGELDITPSREYLSYDDKTINKLQEKINSIYNKILSEFNQEISDCKSLYEARVKFKSNDFCFNLFSDISKLKFIWNGISFDGAANTLNICYDDSNNSYVIKKITKHCTKSTDIKNDFYTFNGKELFIELDSYNSFFSRSKEFLKNNSEKYNVIYLFDFKNSEKLRKHAIETIGLPDSFVFTKVSELPRPKYKSSTSTDNNEDIEYYEYFVNKYGYKKRRDKSSFWRKITNFNKPIKDCYYVLLDSKLDIDGISPVEFEQYYNSLHNISDGKFSLIGIKLKGRNKNKYNIQFKKLSDYIKDLFSDYMLKICYLYENISSRYLYIFLKLHKHLDLISFDNIISEYISLDFNKVKSYYNLYSMFITDNKQTVEIPDIYKKYPMLKYIGEGEINNQSMQDILLYVKNVNRG